MNPKLYGMIYRSTGKIIKGIRRLGIDILPLTRGNGSFAGMRVQWKADEPNAVRGTVVATTVNSQTVRFFVANDLDAIQLHHRRGEFYEPEELAIIADHFTGGIFVDVGSNIGNHAIYALKFLNADRVLAFEPHPVASAALEINLLLNGVSDRATIHRVGLSDKPGRAGFDMLNNNLGATRVVERSDGDGPPLMRGDDVLAGEKVDFIKIDTEGFEMQVLGGLKQTIATQRPTLFVEVENENFPAFEAFCAETGYRIDKTFRRYDTNINVLAVHDHA